MGFYFIKNPENPKVTEHIHKVYVLEPYGLRFAAIPYSLKNSALNTHRNVWEDKKMSEEKDMKMSDDEWNTRIIKVQTWMKEHKTLIKDDEETADSVAILKMNIKRGGKRPEMRKKYWNSILLEGRNLPEWPIQKGKESSLPQHTQQSLKDISAAVIEAYTEFWNENEIIQQVAVISDRNKEVGGSPHESAEEFAKGRGLAVRQRFTKYFNDERWDGQFDLDAGFGINPPESEEEESEDSDAEGETDAS